MLDRNDVTDDGVLGGRLKLLQPRRGHRFGHDAILLAAAVAAEPGEHAVDLCAGVGAAGLALAHRVPGLFLTLVDIDPDLTALAVENARRNRLADRVRALALDVAAPAENFAEAGLATRCAAHVLMNPPFHDEARANLSPDPNRRAAHAAPREALSVWVETAARLLRAGGDLTAIFHADRLGDLTAALVGELGLDAVLPVYSRAGAEAPIRVIVRALKQRPGRHARLPGLALNDEDGRPSAEAEAILRGGSPLPLGCES
jgi:tRNA1(Val) A37 N6-methylase TrmN6